MLLRYIFPAISLCVLTGCTDLDLSAVQNGDPDGAGSATASNRANQAQKEIAERVASDVRNNGCDLSRYADFEKTIGSAVRRIGAERQKSPALASDTAASYSYSLLTVADASLDRGCLNPAEALFGLVLELQEEPAIANYQVVAKAGLTKVAEAKTEQATAAAPKRKVAPKPTEAKAVVRKPEAKVIAVSNPTVAKPLETNTNRDNVNAAPAIGGSGQ